MLQDKWLHIPIEAIEVRRDDRQRRAVRDENGKFINDDGLLDSIRLRGVMNALIVEQQAEGKFLLVAGERRLEACRTLKLPSVPVRFAHDLSPAERDIIELEENLRRLDLPWRDEVVAVAKLHQLYCDIAAREGKKWTRDASIHTIAYPSLNIALRVAKDIDNPKIAGATHIRGAYNILTRLDDRATADAVSDIVDAAGDLFGNTGVQDGGSDLHNSINQRDAAGSERSSVAANAEARGSNNLAGGRRDSSGDQDSQPDSILCADALAWLAQYSGPSFNLIHCDFPYGVNVFGGTMANTQGGQRAYTDEANIYWTLIETLCAALPRVMSHSAHIMFWLSADIPTQWRTLEMFRTLAPHISFLRRMPLIWHKTDNVGILADARRGPRHVYETCLLGSVEDRNIIRAVSDVYGAPTDKSHHPSTKPEPVLRHFMQMLVDENTRLLDPTCGSGSALRAAESLGAKFVLGLERDPEHAAAAASALRSFRTLRKATAR